MSEENESQAPVRNQPAGQAPHSPIYLVSSNGSLAEDTATQLRYFGHILVVVDGIERLAAAIAQRTPAALIIEFDYGEEILAEIAQLARERHAGNRHFPIILISTRGSFEARLAAARAGADCYFTKPLNIAELTDCLDTLVLSKEMHPYRVLIASDEVVNARYYGDVLRNAGMDVRLLHEPSGIFRVFDEYRPEIVVMDVSLPTCTGIDLAKLIRQNNVYLDVPIVFLSCDDSFSKRLDAIRAGAEDFLAKPIAPAHLVSALSSRAERYRALRGLIMRDSLTGLFNHSALKEYLARTMSSTDRAHATLALAMIDLDFFKRINDSYGHPVGDQVLRTLARLLQQRLRRGDIIGRYGGEEFAVILPSANAAAAARVVDRIRESFSGVPHQADEGEFTATFSAGVADIAAYHHPDALFRAADAALYEAKRRGRNRVEIG